MVRFLDERRSTPIGNDFVGSSGGIGFGGGLHLDVMMRHDFPSQEKLKLPEHFATAALFTSHDLINFLTKIVSKETKVFGLMGIEERIIVAKNYRPCFMQPQVTPFRSAKFVVAGEDGSIATGCSSHQRKIKKETGRHRFVV